MSIIHGTITQDYIQVGRTQSRFYASTRDGAPKADYEPFMVKDAYYIKRDGSRVDLGNIVVAQENTEIGIGVGFKATRGFSYQVSTDKDEFGWTRLSYDKASNVWLYGYMDTAGYWEGDERKYRAIKIDTYQKPADGSKNKIDPSWNLKIEFWDILGYSRRPQGRKQEGTVDVKKATLKPGRKVNEKYEWVTESAEFDKEHFFTSFKVFALKDLDISRQNSHINQFFKLTPETDPGDLD